eukprot:208398-Rhodomonas_salina.1
MEKEALQSDIGMRRSTSAGRALITLKANASSPASDVGSSPASCKHTSYPVRLAAYPAYDPSPIGGPIGWAICRPIGGPIGCLLYTSPSPRDRG